MQPERIADAERSDRQQRALLDGQPGSRSRRGVRVVLGGRERHDHVVAVVAAGQEDADERPIPRPCASTLIRPKRSTPATKAAAPSA